MENTKECTKCKETKSEDLFGFTSRGGKKYRRNVCNECRNAQRRAKRINKSGEYSTDYTPRKRKDELGMIFNESEIQTLKTMIEEYQNKTNKSFEEIIKEVLNTKYGELKRTRQTYIMREDLLERMNEFCNENRVNKSDFVNIAIEYFLDKK